MCFCLISLLKNHQKENNVQLFRGLIPIKHSFVNLKIFFKWEKISLTCEFFLEIKEKQRNRANVKALLWIESRESMLRLEIGLNGSHKYRG